MVEKTLSEQVQGIWKIAKKYCSLQFNYAKLTFAEKLVVLLSGIAIAAICFMLASFMILLLSFALVDMLKTVVSPIWAYIIVSAIFVLMIAIIIIFRRSLIVNPISRFISKLFFNERLK